MKQKNIELMQRAIGIVEGVSFTLDEPKASALVTAVEMFDEVLADEEKEKNDAKVH